MKFTGSKAERIVAVLFGALLLLVQLPQIPKLPLFLYGQAVGFDLAWVLITGAGVWLVLYGLGMIRKKPKPNQEVCK
jgi:hypothetical protein